VALNPVALGAAAAGTVLVWAALGNKSVLSTVQGVIKGQSPIPAAAPSGTAPASPGTTITGEPLFATPGTAVPGSPAANQAIGRVLAAPYGWATGTQWDALVSLWDGESGWDNTVWNGGSHATTEPAGSSGAFGIPQALPYSKMPEAAWPAGYGGSASASAQISWGLSYIKSEYGTPEAANSFDKANAGY
jgi:hypothetical protein